MFKLIKLIIWLTGILTLAWFLLHFLGYKINYQYFHYSKKACEKKLNQCERHLIYNGIKQLQCNIKCVNPKLFIKREK